ncbi:MAG TPA: FAD-binding protein [Anaerolineales bacterium]|nr:FAD-binding protein [Anaerolineales bacterium]
MNHRDTIHELQKRIPTGSLSVEIGELNACVHYGLSQQGHPPICILRPGNATELESIIHYANENDHCLVVTSSTGTHRKGGITSQAAHILIDLSRWKKIDLIDRRNRVCRIEPGVNYEDLLYALSAHGMTIPMPLSPRSGKSVLAAVMDREPTTWPNKQWDSSDPVASTDFFFGSGEHFRSGAAGGPGSIEQQRLAGGAQKHSGGPSQTDFHRVVQGSQCTMGIINWITLRAEIKPSVQEIYLLRAEQLDDLLDYTYAVQRALLGEQAFILNRTAAALLLSNGRIENFNEIRASLPKYIGLQNIAGFERLPTERLAYHKQDINNIAHQCNLQLKPQIGRLSALELFEKATQTCGETDWRDTLLGGCISIFFQSTLDRMPALLKVFYKTAEGFGIDNTGIGVYIQPMVQNHVCHMELMIPFHPGVLEEVDRLRKFERQATIELMGAGAFFSRPYGSAAELVWEQNPGNTQLVKIIKDVFDSRQILQREKWFTPEKQVRTSAPKDRDISELENIVGKQWVSTAPCVLDTYAFYMNPETMNKDGSQWLPRPAAVVLPQSTAQVQEIMRFCSTSQYMAKPLSTGFHTAAAASNNKVIILDLIRMNRIIEIDVRNQIAVIEPYVRAIDLQTEIIQHGLNCHIVSSGANHSLLASHTAAWGYGVTGAATSFSGRNLLGVEWVLPSGEAITLGSAGSGCGWFSPDGPGPSMRGIVRGFQGTFGGLGVFTRCAIKLYKWDGPRTWEVGGHSPKYFLKKAPTRCSLQAIAFPSRSAEKDAGYKMGEAELHHGMFRTPMFFAALGLTENNEELKIALESGIFQKIGQDIVSTAVFAASEAEFTWKMKALKEILHETGGVIIPLNLPMRPAILKLAGRLLKNVRDPLFVLRRYPILQDLIQQLPVFNKLKLEKMSTLFWLLFRNANNTQAAFRPSQGMATMLGAFDTWDLAHTQAEYVAKIKLPLIKQGLILDDGGDLGSGGTFENAHLGYLEGIILYDPSNTQSAMAARELVQTGVNDAIDQAMGVPIAAFGVEANQIFGPACNDYHIWLARIKSALDPYTASDPFFYAAAKEKDEGKTQSTHEK